MINLPLEFDEQYYLGLKKFKDIAWNKLSPTKGMTTEEVEEKDNSFSEGEITAIAIFIRGMFVNATETLIEAFNKEAAEKGYPEGEYSHDEWLESNVEMAIEGIPKTVKDILKRNIAKAEGDEESEDPIEKSKSELNNKMEFWAVDQTGEIVNKTSEGLFKYIGLTVYLWCTMEDDRVRPSHEALNRTLRVWGEGISPGEEHRCRCYAALPVIKALGKHILKRIRRLKCG